MCVFVADYCVRETPIIYFGIQAIEAQQNTCLQAYCEPPCKTPSEVATEKEQYYADKLKEQAAKTVVATTTDVNLAAAKEKEAEYYRQQMDKAAYTVVLHVKYDTTQYNADTLATWVENLDVFSMDIIWALREQSNGNYPQAAAALDRAKKRDLSKEQQEDLSNIPILMDALKGRKPTEVEKGHLEKLEELAAVSEGLSGNIARNIMRAHGHYYPPQYSLPKRPEPAKTIPLGLAPVAKREVTVSPNPSNGVFDFSWQPEATVKTEALLQIRDLSGRLVAEQQLLPFERQVIDLKQQRAGVYFYQLVVEGQAPLTGRLVIQ